MLIYVWVPNPAQIPTNARWEMSASLAAPPWTQVLETLRRVFCNIVESASTFKICFLNFLYYPLKGLETYCWQIKWMLTTEGNFKDVLYNLRGLSTRLDLPPFNLEFKHRFFTFFASKLWHALPPIVRESQDIASFMRSLKAHMAWSVVLVIFCK